MNKYPIQLTRVIHENFSVIMNHAYSRRPLTELLEKKFQGEWKYLWKALFDISEEKANRAITELAALLRILDAEEKITDYHKQIDYTSDCGLLFLENGETSRLSFREFSNKVIHSKTFTWDFMQDKHPKLICYAREDEARGWIKAEVDLVGLAGFCGQLMS